MSISENFIKEYATGKDCEAVNEIKGLSYRDILGVMAEVRQRDHQISAVFAPFQHKFTLTSQGLNPLTIYETDEGSDHVVKVHAVSDCGKTEWSPKSKS